ncbi:MAG: hypothetical protein RLZZ242_683 [Bacteroidota bacterium]|jgi:hypothetical protein
MKKLSALFVAIILASCTGPEGPQGPPGPALFSQVIEIEADFSASNGYEVYVEFPQSLEVFEADLVLVYLSYETVSSNKGIQDVWRALPLSLITEQGLLQYQFDHTFTDLRLFVEANYDLRNATAADLENQRFKIAVISAVYAQSIEGLDYLTDADFTAFSH